MPTSTTSNGHATEINLDGIHDIHVIDEIIARGQVSLESGPLTIDAARLTFVLFPFHYTTAASKWYISREALPDGVVPMHKAYLAGWAYILSRDVAEAVVAMVTGFGMHPETQPAWFSVLQWEDVMIGLLVDDIVEIPITNGAFKAAWRSCTNDTAVKHLDVDAPLLMDGLAAQEATDLWTYKTVQCSTGMYVPGDYQGWLTWRRGLPDVARV